MWLTHKLAAFGECRRLAVPLAVVAFALLAGRVGHSAQPAAAPAAQEFTFTSDVAAILFEHCAICHRPGGPAPFSVLSYEDARRRATQIAAVTANRYMPPWMPDSSAAFAGERRLNEREIMVFSRWAAAGAPEGDPSKLPPVPRWPPGWQLGQPDLVIALPEYTLRPDGLDVFRNFVVPIPVSGTRYVRGFEFRAGSTAVHHANIRVDPTPASRLEDEADPAPGYAGLIRRSADYPDGYFLGWTPGQTAPLAPRGFGWRVVAGSDFVVQLHMRPTGKPEQVQPAIGLFFTDEAPVVRPAMLRLGRQSIDIAAGESDYRSTDSYTLPVDVQVRAVQPHSHYRAREVSVRATLPDGTTRSLLNIPRWDFAWQDVYRYAAPFWLPAGTVVRTEYVFDNSAGNPRNPETPPRRALWGFKSSDEMGDVWIQVLTRDDADRRRLTDDFHPKATREDIVGYETQIRLNPEDTALRDDVAIRYLDVGRPEEAAVHFEATVRLRPDSSAAHLNLGTALEAAGRFADAAAEYERAIRIAPEYVAARMNFGNVLLRQGRVSEAERQYREALRLGSSNADAHNNLGRALTARGRYDEALDQLDEALRLRPAFPEAYFNAAEVLLAKHRPLDAVARYRKALDLRQDWAVCLIRLSWTLSTYPDASVRSPDEALALAERSVALTGPDDPSATDALAAAYASAGRFGAASQAASVALQRAKDQDLRTEIRQRLELYQRGEAYRQTIQ
jgi:tetratricopeptide (TPR) repeat protein